MGYFANGTEGAAYHEMYCSRCVHDRNEDCPVWAAHLLYSYRDCNNPTSILHMLIPTNGAGDNDVCALFIERPAAGDLFAENAA